MKGKFGGRQLKEPEMQPLTDPKLMDDEGAQELVNAIFRQACKDWKDNYRAATCLQKSRYKLYYLRKMAEVETWLVDNIFFDKEIGKIFIECLNKGKKLIEVQEKKLAKARGVRAC